MVAWCERPWTSWRVALASVLVSILIGCAVAHVDYYGVPW